MAGGGRGGREGGKGGEGGRAAATRAGVLFWFLKESVGVGVGVFGRVDQPCTRGAAQVRPGGWGVGGAGPRPFLKASVCAVNKTIDLNWAR